MTTSPAIDLLAAALADFQMHVRPLKKKATAQKDGDWFSYAPVDDILKHVRAKLKIRNLYVFQMVTGDIGVSTRLVRPHPSGDQFIEDNVVVSVKSLDDKLEAVTRLRRASLITLLGLPTVEQAAPKTEAWRDVYNRLPDPFQMLATTGVGWDDMNPAQKLVRCRQVLGSMPGPVVEVKHGC